MAFVNVAPVPFRAGLSLRYMKMVATALLAATALAYAGLCAVPGDHILLQALRAAMEAATVGGFADWFAVVALFRQPLGLPIPHTGLIPANQDRIAARIGSFVVNNFATPDKLAGVIERFNLPAELVRWLKDSGNEPTIKAFLAGIAGSTGAMMIMPFVPMAASRLEAKSEAINAVLVPKAAAVIGQNQGAIGTYIANEVRNWNPDEMVANIEGAVGRDLQHIRLNGTIMGGVAGLILFAVRQIVQGLS